MKILLTGHISYTLMAPFYKQLKEQMPTSVIGVHGITRPGKSLSDEELTIFDKIVEIPEATKGEVRKLIYSLRWLGVIEKPIRSEIIRNYIKLKWKVSHTLLTNSCKEHIEGVKFDKISDEYDIINVQFCAPKYVMKLKYLNDKKKVLLSFWGSDLFQLTNKESYKIQLEAINRANKITLHNVEIRQLFLTKFGWKHREKISTVLFGCPTERFDLLDSISTSNERVNSFLTKFHIPPNKFVIQIGYSGGPQHNHIEILQNLERLSQKIKDEICIIIPTTYNNHEEEYYKKLCATISESNFKIIHLTQYMSTEDVLTLPVVANAFIHLRDSDSMNNAMIESLYCGTPVITGSWLYYGQLKRKGIELIEVDSIEETSAHIEHLLSSDNPKSDINKKILRHNFSMKSQIKNWVNIYEELLQGKGLK